VIKFEDSIFLGLDSKLKNEQNVSIKISILKQSNSQGKKL